jgi:beta-aspartyl-peptidase (threonine type)
MRIVLSFLILWLSVAPAVAGDVVLVIHGGAGVAPRAELSRQKEAAVRAELEVALRAGFGVLSKGGSAVDAVSACVVLLEDSPLFNAGRGAALNALGQAELDASIMEGHTLRAGAVAGLHRVKNPVLLARAVMEKSPHVMLVGDGAEVFGRSVGIRMVDPSYFITEERKRDLALEQQQQAKKDGKKTAAAELVRMHMGTVGAVALDGKGRLAAATSTGGLTNKRYGRVGDSPIIGAGTYADEHCGVSATGWGEFFIRVGAARDICARMRYRNDSVSKAAGDVLAGIGKLGGDGGVIALDHRGNVAMPFNTQGMYRGTVTREGKIQIAIYRD